MRTSSFPVAPNRRSLGIGLLLLFLLALLLAWLVAPSTEQAPVADAAAADVAPTRARTQNRVPPPPAPLADPQQDDIRAHAALAEALGYVWVDCPDAGLWSDRPNHDLSFTEVPGRLHFSSSAKSGAVPLRPGEVREGGVDLGPVTRVLTWTTGPDGTTNCREVAPVVGSATIHVVDEHGAPVAVALDRKPRADPGPGDPEDPAGADPLQTTHTVTVYNGGPVWVDVSFVLSPGWSAPTLAVRDGDEALLVVTPTGGATVMDGIHRQRRELLHDATVQLAALEALLADPATDPSLRPPLTRLADTVRSLVDFRSQWFDENGDPVDVLLPP